MAAAIVGRERELRVLDTFLEQTGRRASALLLRGAAGMGKTTLFAETVERARADGKCVLECRPAEAERRLAFAALGDLLRDVIDDVLPALQPPQRRSLEVALLLEEAEEGALEPLSIATACTSAFRHLAEKGLLVAIDDAQWLDPDTAGALAFAARRLTREASGILVSQRTEDDGARVPLELDRAYPELVTLEVGPLTLGAVNHLLQARLDIALPRPVLHRVYRTSGGNPLFALELSRALARRDTLDPGEPLPVPTTLEALVRERLDVLSPEVRRVLAVVAALSDATTDSVKLALEDGDTAGEAIDEAVTSGVLQASGNRLRFTHPLLASAVYGELGPHERQRLHARLANVVTDPEERANQLSLATTRHDESVASAIAEAAELAVRRGAPAVAADLLERAVSLTPESERAALRRRTSQLVDLCVVDGDVERAASLARTLVEEAAGDERRASTAQLAIVRLSEGRRDDVRALVDELLDADTADRARAVALILSATVDVRRLGRRETLARGREAVAIGDRLGDLDIVRDALASVAIDAAWLGEPFVEDVERAAGMGQVAGIFPVGHRSESLAAICRMLFGDELDATRPALEARYRNALAADSAEAQAEALSTLSELERRAGRLERAQEHGDAGLELGDVYLRANLCFMAGFARALRGDLDGARQLAREGDGVVDQAPASASIQLAWLHGAIDLLGGQHLEAVERMTGLPALAEELGIENPTPIQFHPDLVEALLESGDVDTAEDVTARFEDRSERVRHPWALAASGRCRGLVLAARGRLDEATSALEEAVVLASSIADERPLEHGRALLALGTALRRSKRRRDARAALLAAEEIFDRRGAVPWTERAQAELARIAGRAPSGGDLTETERRVAELVAEGLSNKEVAGRLFITVRTVEANLTKIYAKLEVRSRTELAGRFARS